MLKEQTCFLNGFRFARGNECDHPIVFDSIAVKDFPSTQIKTRFMRFKFPQENDALVKRVDPRKVSV